MHQASVAAPVRPRIVRGLRVSLTLVAGLFSGLLLGLAVVVLLATRFFGFSVLTITSDSMAPAIASGDIVVVKPVAIEAVATGDVILFTQGGDEVPTLHRVVGVNEVETRITSRSTGEETTVVDYRLVTQGDANPAPDATSVSSDELHGKLWFQFPASSWLGGISLQGLMFVAAGISGVAWFVSWLYGRRSVR